MLNLSSENIDHLFTFVKSKYVRYYDLQMELVDHLASSIEEEMVAEPALDFKTALHQVYQRWPVTGFNHFIEDKRKGLKTYWRKRFWAYLKRYFQIPTIVVTVFLTMFFYLVTQVQYDLWGIHFNLLYIVLIMLGIKAYFDGAKSILQYPVYGQQNLLTHEVFVEQLGFILIIPGFFIYFLMMEPSSIKYVISASPFLGFAFGLALAITVIVVHAKNTVFNKWIEAEITEKYPDFIQYNISK